MKAVSISRAWFFLMLAIALIFTSCSEETGSLGIYPEQDAISTSTASFGILSNDLLNSVVPANSTACYLGKVIDPETDEAITATFAAQFHTFEDYTFPEKTYIIPDANGHLCESVELRLFIKSTFGDKNNPMKLEVWPLSRDDDKLLKESASLFTDTDLMQYVDDSKGPIATKVFTATDYIVSDSERGSSTYSDNVRIVLLQEMGDNIMETFYSNPSAFRDSYSFIREVCAGFLFRIVSGTGTMLSLEVSTMNVNFSYKDPDDPENTIEALCRFAATPEVIQSTQFESSNLAGLIGNEEYTMLKTPAGICTELILPVDDIFEGHENDSITRASLTLNRINNKDIIAQDDDYALGIPKNLLLVRKQNLSSFFEKHQVSDSQQSYTTSFSSTFNCYTFDNISRIISYCHNEKQAGMKASGMSEDEWEDAHPEWNHVVLVPVTIATASDTYGTTTQVSVNHDLSLCSTKLVRGTEANPIQLQVIYSRFAGK
ncbi:MAG: DUF4270 domain-containing protein [Bacteroidaceae bacterium]|nr:DUF4270 domain-containing protein [Bacteroidaceae bacterium]